LGEAEVHARVRTYAGDRPIHGFDVCSGGLVNQNVVVDLGAPFERVVLRIFRREDAAATAAKESALLRRLPAGVPAPEVLELSTISGTPQAVHTFRIGRALSTLLAEGDEASWTRAGTDVGSALAALHAIPRDENERKRFGFLDGKLHVREPMGALPEVWQGYIEEALESGRAGERLSEDESAALLGFARAEAHRLSTLEGAHVLLHGDCKPTNILVRAEGTLSAFLDWEFSFSGPALFDLGQMLRWPVPRPFEDAFLSAYQKKSARLPEDWRALSRMLDLLNLVGFLDMSGERPVVNRDCRRMIHETLGALA
jgi:aminoglycoside phosphotransferase (APT) family kinase protein